jgi:hypothetical protein
VLIPSERRAQRKCDIISCGRGVAYVRGSVMRSIGLATVNHQRPVTKSRAVLPSNPIKPSVRPACRSLAGAFGG